MTPQESAGPEAPTLAQQGSAGLQVPTVIRIPTAGVSAGAPGSPQATQGHEIMSSPQPTTPVPTVGHFGLMPLSLARSSGMSAGMQQGTMRVLPSRPVSAQGDRQGSATKSAQDQQVQPEPQQE